MEEEVDEEEEEVILDTLMMSLYFYVRLRKHCHNVRPDSSWPDTLKKYLPITFHQPIQSVRKLVNSLRKATTFGVKGVG